MPIVAPMEAGAPAAVVPADYPSGSFPAHTHPGAPADAARLGDVGIAALHGTAPLTRDVA